MPKGTQTKEVKAWVTLPDGTRKRMSFYGRTPEEARAKAKEMERPVLATEFPAGSFGWWLVVKWSPLKAGLEDNTAQNYNLAANHLLGEMGRDPVSSIDATRLHLALTNLSNKKKKRGDGTLGASLVNRCRSIALEVMELAYESDACRHINPKRVRPLQETAKSVDVYSPKEMRRLLEYTKGSTCFAPVLFACFCGLTLNEARALRREDLTELGMLLVRHHMKPDGTRSKKMKTEYRSRVLPLPSGLLQEVRELARGGEWLCRARHGGLVYDGNVDRSLYPKMKRAGLRRLTMHELRHSFSAWLDENGCPRSVRLALMGQSRKAVQDRYNHATADAMREWLGKIWEASLEPWAEGEEPQEELPQPGPRNPARGERNGRSKLDWTKVEEIRVLIEEGETDWKIAKRYAVDPKAVRNIREGKTWVSRQASTESCRTGTTEEGDRVRLKIA
jgi:integrase